MEPLHLRFEKTDRSFYGKNHGIYEILSESSGILMELSESSGIFMEFSESSGILMGCSAMLMAGWWCQPL